MRWRFSTVAAAGAALMLSACASSVSAGGIDAATKVQLQRDVQTLTQASQHHQYSGAHTALTRLNADLAAANAAGKVTDAKLRQIRASAAKVFADLAAVPLATPTVAVPATPPARPSPDQPKPGHGNGKGNGNGNSNHGGRD